MPHSLCQHVATSSVSARPINSATLPPQIEKEVLEAALQQEVGGGAALAATRARLADQISGLEARLALADARSVLSSSPTAHSRYEVLGSPRSHLGSPMSSGSPTKLSGMVASLADDVGRLQVSCCCCCCGLAWAAAVAWPGMWAVAAGGGQMLGAVVIMLLGHAGSRAANSSHAHDDS
jgi:hypothetical protein